MFSNIEVGAKIYIEREVRLRLGGFGDNTRQIAIRAKVIHVTPTQIVIQSNERFRKDTGAVIGKHVGRYRPRIIHPDTDVSITGTPLVRMTPEMVSWYISDVEKFAKIYRIVFGKDVSSHEINKASLNGSFVSDTVHIFENAVNQIKQLKEDNK